MPVLVAGGEKMGDLESLRMIRESVHAGGAGVCVGRNAFQRVSPGAFVKALGRVVHDDLEPALALERSG